MWHKTVRRQRSSPEEAIRELFEDTGDAPIQNEIAVRAELDRATISQVLRSLESKELVDRGVDVVGTAWRIILTPRSVSILAAVQPKIRAVSSVIGAVPNAVAVT